MPLTQQQLNTSIQVPAIKQKDYQLSFNQGGIPLWPGKPTVMVPNRTARIAQCKCANASKIHTYSMSGRAG